MQGVSGSNPLSSTIFSGNVRHQPPPGRLFYGFRSVDVSVHSKADQVGLHLRAVQWTSIFEPERHIASAEIHSPETRCSLSMFENELHHWPENEMQENDDELLTAFKTLGIRVGDIFEDCAFHPVLCLGVDYQDDNIWGVSLIDGSYPRSCSLLFCGVRKLSLDEAWKIKTRGPSEEKDAAQFSLENRWWREPLTPDAAIEIGDAILPRGLALDPQSKDQAIGPVDA